MGSRASFVRRVVAADIEAFAELSGDRSPLHLDESYAATTEMGGRVAHGMLIGAFFSQLIGMHLPGRFALHLSQSLDFVLPVRAGDELEISGEVLAKQDATRTIVLRTEARIVGGDIVARGRAVVKVLR